MGIAKVGVLDPLWDRTFKKCRTGLVLADGLTLEERYLIAIGVQPDLRDLIIVQRPDKTVYEQNGTNENDAAIFTPI